MNCDAAVGILLEDCRVLMIRRKPDPRDPFSWNVSFPGGSVEPGDESCLDTAIREVREEVNLSLDPNSLTARMPVISPLSRKMRVLPFVFRVSQVSPKVGEEVEGFFWMDLRDMREGFAFIPRRNILVRAISCCGYVVWGMSYRLLKLLAAVVRCDDRIQQSRGADQFRQINYLS